MGVLPAVILAAGLSTRMGRVKATLPLPPTDTFITRIIRTLLDSDVDDIVAVLGHEAAAVAESIVNSGLPARVVVNDAYETGQFSSLLAGLNAIDRPGVRGMLFTLVDVPLVSPETVRAVIARYRGTGAPVVRAVRGDEHGHPVLIDRSLFAQLRAADRGAGAKPVVRAHASSAGDVVVDDPGAFLDIDTPQDYERVVDRLNSELRIQN